MEPYRPLILTFAAPAPQPSTTLVYLTPPMHWTSSFSLTATCRRVFNLFSRIDVLLPALLLGTFSLQMRKYNIKLTVSVGIALLIYLSIIAHGWPSDFRTDPRLKVGKGLRYGERVSRIRAAL